MMFTRCGIMLNAFCMYMSWCMNVRCMFLSGKINPWLLLRSSWEVESWIAVRDEEYTYLHTLLKGCFCWGISLACQLLSGRVQASQFAEDEEVNCYLVESRLHGNLLGKDKLTIIWSDPGFAENFLKLNCYLVESRLHNNWLGIRKLNVIWSDSRLCSNLLERMKLKWYLVGSKLPSNLKW